MKILLIDYEKCSGCLLCMLACSFAHEGVFSLRKSRIWVHRNEAKALFIPTVCESCAHIPCVYNCPVGAITYNEKLGTPVVDQDACIGCGLCTNVCPFGGIRLDPISRKALKCDLCNGEYPKCVEVCPLPGAIQFVDITKENLRKKYSLAFKRIEIVEKESKS